MKVQRVALTHERINTIFFEKVLYTHRVVFYLFSFYEPACVPFMKRREEYIRCNQRINMEGYDTHQNGKHLNILKLLVVVTHHHHHQHITTTLHTCARINTKNICVSMRQAVHLCQHCW